MIVIAPRVNELILTRPVIELINLIATDIAVYAHHPSPIDLVLEQKDALRCYNPLVLYGGDRILMRPIRRLKDKGVYLDDDKYCCKDDVLWYDRTNKAKRRRETQ